MQPIAGVAACAPRSRAFEPARSGARPRLRAGPPQRRGPVHPSQDAAL